MSKEKEGKYERLHDGMTSASKLSRRSKGDENVKSEAVGTQQWTALKAPEVSMTAKKAKEDPDQEEFTKLRSKKLVAMQD